MHIMDLPRRVIIGEDLVDKVGIFCEELELRGKSLLVTGPTTFQVAGRKAMESLKDVGFDSYVEIVRNSDIDTVKKVQEKIKRLNPSFVIAVGGGKVIDVAKYSSFLERIPFISFPTAASHDGISSTYASIKGLRRPVSVKAHAPIAIIADVKLIERSPPRLTRSGFGDVISKLTAVRDWKLSHEETNEYYGDYAAQLALMSSELVMKNAESIGKGETSGIRTLIEALISCGVAISIAGSTRPCSGSEHMFSHALDLIAPNSALHGEQCGVGTIMMAYLHGIDWELVKKSLSLAKAPTTSKELGVKDEYVIKALLIAKKIRPERYTILNKIELDEEKARDLARSTGVIN